MTKNKLKARYEIAVHIALILSAVILAFIGHHISGDTIKAIVLNLSSGILCTSILFFLIVKFAALGADSDRGGEDKISVVLSYGVEKLELPVEIRRKEFSRAEILGRIGMIPLKKTGKRFSLGYLNSVEFLKQINQINEGDGDSILTIPCNETEFSQFALNACS